ncbi:MAG: putative toxin-antitoxin system toxin component, PIN family [Bacteroides sp.]|nr:putative toxin-antitoxin system toxin component, PIN family [Eubacterium sp.]MCM1418411.1 putative toxin-antitoxin system toxin component, PIN family [Roseburia sp.]MCM1461567.1 putative toxin-antitoxin system toxin component, PIN family [Bacteroides sp.]
MLCYAVIDTNVLVAALISKNPSSPTVEVFNAVLDGRIVPLYHSEIVAEYADVLRRPKFHQSAERVDHIVDFIKRYGIEVSPTPTGEIFPDMDDLVFYEVAMEKQSDGAYLVTGNQKHYPARAFIVTPTEMVEILHDLTERQK